MKSFQGKIAVVTGGGNGIGRELVRQLAAEGCSVAICDLNHEAATATAEIAIAEGLAGAKVTAHFCDVSDEASVTEFRDQVLAEHRTDHINLLFNNAGIVGAPSFVADERADWERVFNVCWNGVYYCTRAFMPLLVAGDEGLIVNTSSILGFWATNGPAAPFSAYATAKFAVKGFSEALIDDLRAHAPHVKVALVMPGFVGTGIAANSAAAMAGGDGDQTAELQKILAGWGMPIGNGSAERLRELAETANEICREFAPISAPEAASMVLTGLREGRWRILVGDDAVELDQIVRADPDGAYDPGFWAPALLVDALLRLAAGFDPEADLGLSGSFELRLGAVRVAVRVAEGGLSLERGGVTAPEATASLDPTTLDDLLARADTVEAAEERGTLKLEGDRGKFEQLIAAAAVAR